MNIKRIVDEYKRRVENNLDIPAYLKKQNRGIAEGGKRGIAILIDGLKDEADHLDALLDREWMDGLSEKQWINKLEKIHDMKVTDV